jgi:hypothetical protein
MIATIIDLLDIGFVGGFDPFGKLCSTSIVVGAIVSSSFAVHVDRLAV